MFISNSCVWKSLRRGVTPQQHHLDSPLLAGIRMIKPQLDKNSFKLNPQDFHLPKWGSTASLTCTQTAKKMQFMLIQGLCGEFFCGCRGFHEKSVPISAPGLSSLAGCALIDLGHHCPNYGIRGPASASSSFLYPDDQLDDVFLCSTLKSIWASVIASFSKVKKMRCCTLNKPGSRQTFF